MVKCGLSALATSMSERDIVGLGNSGAELSEGRAQASFVHHCIFNSQEGFIHLLNGHVH